MINLLKGGRAVTLLAFLTVLILLSPYGNRNACAIDPNTYKSLKTFSEVLDLVEKNYVEPVNSEQLFHGAINGIMKSLDPHSAFMTAEQYQDMEIETKGSFGGLGIEITVLQDVLTVVSPIEDTPAYHAGIKAGDQILKIDGRSTKDITINEAAKQLRGVKGTQVTLTIFQKKVANPREIEVVLTRDIIRIRTIRTKVYDGQIGYIRVAAFQERTVEDMRKALLEMQTQTKPLKGIVLDMRNNPGGLLHQAVEMSDLFLKSGDIVSTRGRSKAMESRSVARDEADEPTCPVVILVNEGTASAAEIVAGALQDNSRAIILGTQTFGKASVQTLIPLEDGSALKLTTARYYTPKGRSIQAEGISPDIVVKYDTLRPGETNENEGPLIREKDLEGHFKSAKELEGKQEDPKKEPENSLAEDSQLKQAIDILKSWEILNHR